MLAALTAGAALGFLIYNFPPASSFMGDSGANLLGLLMGVITVEAAVKTAAVVSFVLPLILLAVPFLDTTFVVLKRLKYRQPIYRPGQRALPSPDGEDRLLQPADHRLSLRLDADARGLALALRFVPYSDHKGHLHLGWTIVMILIGLLVVAASVYLVYVLEILKFRRLDSVRLRRLRPGRLTSGDRHGRREGSGNW